MFKPSSRAVPLGPSRCHRTCIYLIKRFGDIPVSKLDSFQIQIWLNEMAEQYSESVVRSCYSNIRAITAMARKQKFLRRTPEKT